MNHVETLAQKARRQLEEGAAKTSPAAEITDTLGQGGSQITAADEPEAQDLGKTDCHDEGAPTASEINAAKNAASEAKLVAMNQDHFVATEGGHTFVFRETVDHELDQPLLQRLTVPAFKQLHSNQTTKITDQTGNETTLALAPAWLNWPKRRTYSGGTAMLPAGNAPTGVYNLWRGFGAVPKVGATQQDAAPALDHIRNAICGGVGVYYEYLVCWLAYCVQHPDRQAEVAVVLQGGQGTGKGTLGRWFRDMFGAHGMHIQQSRHLTGNFNAHLRTAVAIFVDESFFVGDRAGNSVLKALITEDQMTIERKGIDAGSVRNRLKIMMATNDAHAILAGGDERRYFVLEVANVVAQNHAYFANLATWWGSGGKEALLGYLMDVDLSHFNIRAVPNTRALEAQKLASLSAFDTWLYDKLTDGHWDEQTTAKKLAGEFEFNVRERGLRYENTSSDAVGKQLRKRMKVRRVREAGGSREWQLTLPTRELAREQFLRSLGIDSSSGCDEDDGVDALDQPEVVEPVEPECEDADVH